MGAEEIGTVAKELDDDQEWVAKLMADRKRRAEKAQERRRAFDGDTALTIRCTAERISGEGCPERITLEKIIREAGEDGAKIRQCLDEPLTKETLASVIDSEDGIIRKRIEWGKRLGITGFYDFLDRTKLRGIDLPKWAESEILGHIEENKKIEEERERTEDLEGAEKVRAAARRLRGSEGRPKWISITALIKEAGLLKFGPVTDKVLQQEKDTSETLLERRIAWAKETLPKGEDLQPLRATRLLGPPRVEGIPERTGAGRESKERLEPLMNRRLSWTKRSSGMTEA